MSCSKGEGMALHEKKPGTIFLVAGGTGVYPFIDLIDVLFKKMLVEQNHNSRQKILESTPAVQDVMLSTFKFVFMASFNSLTDLHPITQYQCRKLSENNSDKFKCYFKVKGQSNSMSEKSNIQYTNERFERILEQEVNRINIENLSQIYLCGPGKMTGPFIKLFEEKGIAQDSYKII